MREEGDCMWTKGHPPKYEAETISDRPYNLKLMLKTGGFP